LGRFLPVVPLRFRNAFQLCTGATPG
jgi:hypothetical protein